jgi:hypothetical protein
MTPTDQYKDRSTPPAPVLIAYYALLIAFGAAIFFPHARLWGFNWYRYFPWYVLAATVLVAVWLPFLCARLVHREHDRPAGSGRSFALFTALTVAGSGAAMVLLRGRTHFLGDGYQVLDKLTADGELVKPWDSTVWHVQRTIYGLLGGGGEATSLLALQTLSIGCGLLLTVLICWTAARLFDHPVSRMMFILGLISGGYMLLFYGYVENYPLFVLTLFAFALFGLLAARSRLHRLWILPPALLLCFLHPFGAVVSPAAVYLLFRGTGVGSRIGRLRLRAWGGIGLVLAVIAFALTAYLWQTSYFFRFSLVPPIADRFTFEGYTLLSFPHLLDLINLLVMLFPGALLVLSALDGPLLKRVIREPEYRFLLLLLGSCLAAVFVLNPRLGMARDWDLFSFVGVPLALTGTYILIRERSSITGALPAAALVATMGLFLLGPRVVSQIDPERSIAVLDHFVDLDVVKSRNGRFLLLNYLEREGRMDEYYRRTRINAAKSPHEQLSESGKQLGEAGRFEEAARKFRRALQYDPTFPYAWSNLGVIYVKTGQLDSAIACLKIADGLNPFSYATYMKLAGAYYLKQEYGLAEEYWRRAIAVYPADNEARAYLLKLYRDRERWPEYDSLLDDLIALPGCPSGFFLEAARRALRQSDTALSIAYLWKARARSDDSADFRLLLEAYPDLAPIDH